MSDPIKLYPASAGVQAMLEADPSLTADELRAEAIPVLGTVVIEGGLTDAELRASAVPVSGPLTDAQLRATAVPVSGTVSVGNFPATQPVSGSVSVSNFPATPDPEYTHVVATVTASGDTTIHTPGTGLAVRLRSVLVSTEPGAATPPVVSVKLGATEVFRTYGGEMTQRVTGAADAALVIGLTGTGSVAVTAVLEEV